MFRKLIDLLAEKNQMELKDKDKDEEAKLNYIGNLPDEIFKDTLFELAGPKAAVAFSKTSKRYNQLFQPQIDPQRLIHHIAYSQQDQAEAILKKISMLKDEKALNNLLTKKMDVTDLSGKKFKNITVFQYALWALDWRMWEMLSKYLQNDKAKSQLEEMEKSGIMYIETEFCNQKEKSVMGEKHFDFSPLTMALKDYVDNYGIRNWHQRVHAWCKNVGSAQRSIPAHVAKSYCRSQGSESKFPKSLTVYDYTSHFYSFWPDSISELGYKFAVGRGNHAVAIRCSGGRELEGPMAIELAHDDLLSIIALFEESQNKFKMLKTNLITPLMTLTSS